MNRQSCVSVLSLMCLSASASGGPILLASYSQTLSSARSGWSEPRVQFELTLQTSSMSGPIAGIGRGVFWSGDASSFFDFDIDNSPEFPDFEGFATNGLNNKFTIFNLWSDGTGGGSGGAESALFGLHPPIGHPPDLIGYDLESVRLIVNSLEFVPWIPPSGPIGLRSNYHVTYEFYGTVVPEPESILLIGMGLILFSGACRAKRQLL